MTITRVAAETELVSRAKKKMELVGFAITVDGTNADLISPLAAGVRGLGYSLATAGLVTDADLASVTDADTDEFYDRAELRLLRNIHNNINMVDITTGPMKEALGQLAVQVEKAIEMLRTKITVTYGDDGPGTAFSVGLNREDGYSEAADLSEA